MSPDFPDDDLPPRRRPVPPRSGTPPLLLVALGVAVGAAVVWAGLGVWKAARDPAATEPNAVERAAAPRTDPDGEEQEAIRIFKSARAAVVNVDTVVRVRQFNMGVQEQQTGTGSGFVWDSSGRVVTNYHVVEAAAAGKAGLRVVLSDRTTRDATVVGVAPDQDLAVVQVAGGGDGLTVIRVGRSNDLEVGQKVFAIGNPFGLSSTMTKGIISALDREIESPTKRVISGAIQTDAPINPGNSGGPLLDKDGRLVGVNTSIASPSGGNVGIGFAIPVDTVNAVVTDIIRHGRVLRADIGVRLVDQRSLRRAGYATGVMAGQVDPAGPAAKAGVRGVTGEEPGDLILKVDGVDVRSNAEFTRLIAGRKPGDVVKLTIRRGDEQTEVSVTLRGV